MTADPEGAAPRAEGLDVELLTVALEHSGFHSWFNGYETASEMADVLAAKYAAAARGRFAARLSGDEGAER